MALFSRDRSSVCASCGRPAAEVNPIIKGPGLGICEACVRAAIEAIVRGSSVAVLMPGAQPKRRAPRKCSFCGRPPLDGRRLAVVAGGATCDSCLKLSSEVFARGKLDAAT
jgi:ribosomal protein S14